MKCQKDLTLNPNDFRAELIKIMPGYKWTVHKPHKVYDNPVTYLRATGVQTSGSNRLSTLEVLKRKKGDVIEYEARSAGLGLRAIWLATRTEPTLARAFRSLQNHYQSQAALYGSHAAALETGRQKPGVYPEVKE